MTIADTSPTRGSVTRRCRLRGRSRSLRPPTFRTAKGAGVGVARRIGDAITFGSAAHLPELVGHGFRDAAAMAEAHGFRFGRTPHDLRARVR